MSARGAMFVAVAAILLAAVAAVPAHAAQPEQDVEFLSGVTQEGKVSIHKLVLKGDEVLWAFFNFTVVDDIPNSEPDSFVFTVTNSDDPSVRQSMPGSTGHDGRLAVSLPFSLKTSTVWNVEVRCTAAGDLMLGPIVREADTGNDWDLMVEYAHQAKGTDGGDGGGGGDADGDAGEPRLVRAFQANLAGIAGLSLLVVALSVRGRSREEGLAPQYALGTLLLLDAFVSLPIALVINLEENGALLTTNGPGPAWLGDLAVLLLVIWAVPFVVPARRVLTSRTARDVLTRFVGASAARAARRLGRRFRHDPLSFRGLSDLLSGVGLASAVVAVMMLVV
jgi:hypothetical protein